MHHVFLLGDSIRMGRDDGLPGYEPALRALSAGAERKDLTWKRRSTHA